MVEVLCNVGQQLLGVKGDRMERLGPCKNTGGGKRHPRHFGWGREASGIDVLHVAALVVVVGLVTTAAEHMTMENKFLLAPRSHGLYPNGMLVCVVGSVDLGEEEDLDGEVIGNGIFEVAVLEKSPLEGHRMSKSVFWHTSPSV